MCCASYRVCAVKAKGNRTRRNSKARDESSQQARHDGLGQTHLTAFALQLQDAAGLTTSALLLVVSVLSCGSWPEARAAFLCSDELRPGGDWDGVRQGLDVLSHHRLAAEGGRPDRGGDMPTFWLEAQFGRCICLNGTGQQLTVLDRHQHARHKA